MIFQCNDMKTFFFSVIRNGNEDHSFAITGHTAWIYVGRWYVMPFLSIFTKVAKWIKLGKEMPHNVPHFVSK